MNKRLILILALTFAVGLSLAYAEVQNVKVSGDITLMGIYRNNIDLAKERATNPVTNNTIIMSDKQRNVLSSVRLRVDADLTDNVSTVVRLINERDWGEEDAANTDIDLDLAYVTMKEFLYSPLTLALGRQELHFGNDMIVGDPDTNNNAATVTYNEADLSQRKAFDAIRATLNYDPMVVDLVWSKISEGNAFVNNDTNLYGINANYALDKATTLEAYAFVKTIDSNAAQFTGLQRTQDLDPGVDALNVTPTKADKVYTIGAKVKNTSIKDLSVSLESAFQFGRYNPGYDINSAEAALTMSRRAWALELLANYDLKDAPIISKYAKYSPSISATYCYFSGDNPAEKRDTKKWHGWDPMYENQTFGHLANAIFDQTNMQLVGLGGKCKPIEDVTVNLDYYYYWLVKAYAGAEGLTDWVTLKNNANANIYQMTHNRHLGQEIDLKLTYDYTEDVQFGLLAGVFLPGSAFLKGTTVTDGSGRNAAGEVIGSMRVTF